jgi:predicted DNA-binding transcriptional regulator AlpA
MLKVLSQAEVCAALDIDPSTLWSFYKCGHFPAPIELGIPGGIRTKIGWREDEVDAWIESRPRCGEPPMEMVPKDIAEIDQQDMADGFLYSMYLLLYGTEEQREDIRREYFPHMIQKP